MALAPHKDDKDAQARFKDGKFKSKPDENVVKRAEREQATNKDKK